MTFILKNKNLEIHIDHPAKNYKFSRFDWSGKIAEVLFKNIPLTQTEKFNGSNEHVKGKGCYNEFGINEALGFDDTDIGGWFHKIGIGLLKKTDSSYHFEKPYDIKPAQFSVKPSLNNITIKCKSDIYNGYAYVLKKNISLLNSGFLISYELENRGSKDIITDEYTHNFIAINNTKIGSAYDLKFPNVVHQELFDEVVNPEKLIKLSQNSFEFIKSPSTPFFFSNLSGGKKVRAQWEIQNIKNQIAIKEVGDFFTKKINLWGCNHVISPEMFHQIQLKPGEISSWSRSYTVMNMTR